MQFLGSERYVKAKLEGLAPVQLSKVREAFVKNSHLVDTSRLAKPLTTSRALKNADSEKLARLIKIVGMLLQTKVYLFWSMP